MSAGRDNQAARASLQASPALGKLIKDIAAVRNAVRSVIANNRLHEAGGAESFRIACELMGMSSQITTSAAVILVRYGHLASPQWRRDVNHLIQCLTVPKGSIPSAVLERQLNLLGGLDERVRELQSLAEQNISEMLGTGDLVCEADFARLLNPASAG